MRQRNDGGDVTDNPKALVRKGRNVWRIERADKPTVIVDAAQPLTLEVDGGDSGITSRLVLPDRAAEYRFRSVDEDGLKSIASATGGTWMPSAAALANRDSEARTERRPLWTALILSALAMWLLDIGLRRIRILEAASSQPPASS